MNSQASRNPMLALANAIYDVRPPVLKGMKIDVDKNGLDVVRLEVAMTSELIKAWGEACTSCADSKERMDRPSVGDEWAGGCGTGWMEKRGHGLPPVLDALSKQVGERTDVEVASVMKKLDALKPAIEEILSGYHHSTYWFEYRDHIEQVLRTRIGHRISHEVAARVVGDDGTKQ